MKKKREDVTVIQLKQYYRTALSMMRVHLLYTPSVGPRILSQRRVLNASSAKVLLHSLFTLSALCLTIPKLLVDAQQTHSASMS